MSNPQKENGFTPISNELLEAFYCAKLTEYERVCMLHIWRQTYGWGKKDDWIANSQFSKKTGIPKPHITRTLKALKNRNIVTSSGNKITVNKRYSEWKVFWRVLPPQVTGVTSSGNKVLPPQVPTKEKKETNTKDISNVPLQDDKLLNMKNKFNPLGVEIIKEFELVDIKNKRYYANTTQRKACDFLIEEYGLQEVKNRIAFLEKTNSMKYFPTITTPHQLVEKWVQLEKAVQRIKNENKNTVAF